MASEIITPAFQKFPVVAKGRSKFQDFKDYYHLNIARTKFVHMFVFNLNHNFFIMTFLDSTFENP